MICGVDEVDVEDWKAHTLYDGYSSDQPAIINFWQVVSKMSPADHGLLLQFCTGSSQVPSGGFRFLQPNQFTIQRCADTTRLPEAHTCVNMLDLPPYEDYKELKERLLYAIHQVGDAFGRV